MKQNKVTRWFSKIMAKNMYKRVILKYSNKKELKFPKRWKYNFDLRSWYSEDYVYRKLGTREFAGYIYMPDEFLVKLQSKEE